MKPSLFVVLSLIVTLAAGVFMTRPTAYSRPIHKTLECSAPGTCGGSLTCCIAPGDTIGICLAVCN
ncbi:MAG TPA: hypothetical protein VFG76_09605 [Candidatus Polarisedimenticolia bacterium]|nr:hypothetical protein [Candidatus Polarisedimenticolia bacterium]